MSNVNEIKTRIKQKIDTLANWIENDPILYSGELAIVKLDNNTCRIKVGDGVSNFSQLNFTDSSINIGTLDNINMTDSLSIITITPEDYANLLANDNVLSNQIYIISSDYIYGFDKPITHVADGIEDSDVVTVKQLNNLKSDVDTILEEKLISQVEQFTNNAGDRDTHSDASMSDMDNADNISYQYCTLENIGLKGKEVKLKTLALFRRQGSTANYNLDLWLRILRWNNIDNVWYVAYQANQYVTHGSYTKNGQRIDHTLNHIAGSEFIPTNEKIIICYSNSNNTDNLSFSAFGAKVVNNANSTIYTNMSQLPVVDDITTIAEYNVSLVYDAQYDAKCELADLLTNVSNEVTEELPQRIFNLQDKITWDLNDFIVSHIHLSWVQDAIRTKYSHPSGSQYDIQYVFIPNANALYSKDGQTPIGNDTFTARDNAAIQQHRKVGQAWIDDVIENGYPKINLVFMRDSYLTNELIRRMFWQMDLEAKEADPNAPSYGEEGSFSKTFMKPGLQVRYTTLLNDGNIKNPFGDFTLENYDVLDQYEENTTESKRVIPTYVIQTFVGYRKGSKDGTYGIKWANGIPPKLDPGSGNDVLGVYIDDVFDWAYSWSYTVNEQAWKIAQELMYTNKTNIENVLTRINGDTVTNLTSIPTTAYNLDAVEIKEAYLSQFLNKKIEALEFKVNNTITTNHLIAVYTSETINNQMQKVCLGRSEMTTWQAGNNVKFTFINPLVINANAIEIYLFDDKSKALDIFTEDPTRCTDNCYISMFAADGNGGWRGYDSSNNYGWKGNKINPYIVFHIKRDIATYDDINELSNAITTKSAIFCCNNDEVQFNDSLSIITVTPEEYTAKLTNNEIQPNQLYIVQADHVYGYNKQITHVADGIEDSDVATVKQLNTLSDAVDNLVNSTSSNTLNQANEYTDELCVSLSTTVDAFINDSTNIHNELQSNIDNKIYISDVENGERYSDLSVIKLTEEEYNLLVYNKQVDHNTLYVVESENLNAYGNVISNVIMTDDLFESEAATKHYVDTHLAEIEQKFLTADNDNKAPTESPTFSGTVRLTETPENECDDDVIVNAGWVRKNQLNLPSYDSITHTSVGTTLTASQFIAETDGWFAFQITGVRHTNNQIYLDINGQKTFRALPSGGMSNFVQQVNLTTQFLYLHAGTVISCSYTGTFSSNTSLSEFTVIHAN